MAYDPTNKRIYIDTSTTPHTGVSVDDVCDGLGLVGVGDIGTLCKSSRINPWAKYKPVEYSSVGLTGKTSGSGYWRGMDGQCGLSIPKGTNSNTLARTATAWSMAVPTTWFRLLDFDGYDASGAVSGTNPATLPTGKLAEASQGTIAFMNGVPVFHVDLGPQDGSGYFLRAQDISLHYSDIDVPLLDMCLGLDIVSSDGSEVISLPCGAQKLDTESHETDYLVDMSLGEMRDAGMTQVTFSPYYTFTVEGVTAAPQAGDIYTYSDSQFLIQEVVLDGSTLAVSSLVCIRKSGSATLPYSSYLSRSTGSGDASIRYLNLEVQSYTFGSRTFYVFPYLYNKGGRNIFYCGLGSATPQLTLASRTDTVVGRLISLATNAYNENTTATVTLSYSVSNGFSTEKQITLRFYIGRGISQEQAEERQDYSNPTTTMEVTIPPYQTSDGSFSYNDTRTGSYVVVSATYQVSGQNEQFFGNDMGDYIFYFNNGQPYTPQSQ